MRRRIDNGDTSHADRWMVSYADFMTLLFGRPGNQCNTICHGICF